MHIDYDVIVIGSGLGGLTAGALFARAGHRVLILERNAEFGGAATTYQHGSLTIEASLHETTDPHNPRDWKSRAFRALGILDDLEFVPVGDFYQVRGRLFDPPFSLPHGFDAVEKALAARFPSHRKAFRRLFERMEAVQNATALVGEQHDSLWWFLHAPMLPLKLWPLLRGMRQSVSDVFTELFGDDELPKIALAANLAYHADDPDKLWWILYAVLWGEFLASGGTYIRGGSGTLSRRLVGVVEEEGGAAQSGRTVTDILLDEDGHAVGVAHAASDGSDRQEERAPVLFGNAAPAVLADALPPEARERFSRQYEGRKQSISLFTVSLGLNRRPSELGFTHYSTMLIPDWLESLSDYSRSAILLADPPAERMPVMSVVDYSAVDSGLNPQGPYLVSVVGVDRVANWEGLDEQAYQSKRDTWLAAIIAEINRTFPGFADAVVQREMATALTMRRYLNTPEGAVYGFAAEPPSGRRTARTEKAVETNVPGLWLASAYGGFGGFTGAMMTG
ncbi:MAG: NAD(P)/FAD-dependent oxidoreductase, partial [Proteobacteria bacterium]|nr:NAD(P)/FAD-dependent oxidoreductase [Pseudomonadota bacterium]